MSPFCVGAKLTGIEKTTDSFVLHVEGKEDVETGFLLNATYAATNQILGMLGYEKFGIKYELARLSSAKSTILCVNMASP